MRVIDYLRSVVGGDSDGPPKAPIASRDDVPVNTLDCPPGGERKDITYEEFKLLRRYERDAFDSALKGWLLNTGVGPHVLSQTEEFAHEADLDGWGDQMDIYRHGGFDVRRPVCAELLVYLLEQVDPETCPDTVAAHIHNCSARVERARLPEARTGTDDEQKGPDNSTAEGRSHRFEGAYLF